MKLLSFMIIMALTACTDTDFSGDLAKRGADRGNADADDDDPDGSAGGGDSDGADSGVDSDGDNSDSDIDGDDSNAGEDDDVTIGNEDVVAPKPCNSETIKIVPDTGAACPAHYAAYAIDDAPSARIACCPLPAKNILSKDPPSARQVCLSDEVATGVNGGILSCTKINTSKYSLSAPQKTCYVGSGFSGGGGTADCGVPPPTMAAMTTVFGKDACIGQPYGALIVGHTKKYCRDMTSSQLIDAATGQPVTMFE